jgi:hypothetical protein
MAQLDGRIGNETISTDHRFFDIDSIPFTWEKCIFRWARNLSNEVRATGLRRSPSGPPRNGTPHLFRSG